MKNTFVQYSIYLGLLASLAYGGYVHADTNIAVLLASKHIGITSDAKTGRKFNEFNPGIGVRFDNTLTLGCYYNSVRHVSCAVGIEKPVVTEHGATLGIRTALANYGSHVLPMASVFAETSNGWRLDLVLNARREITKTDQFYCTDSQLTRVTGGDLLADTCSFDQKVVTDDHWKFGAVLALSKYF